mgnify:CR=1 FL=1
MDVYSFLIQLLNSVQYGLLLFLVASGLTLIFGIMGIINLAHGSFYMIGAYMAFALASLTGNLFVAIVLGIVLSVALGVDLLLPPTLRSRPHVPMPGHVAARPSGLAAGALVTAQFWSGIRTFDRIRSKLAAG